MPIGSLIAEAEAAKRRRPPSRAFDFVLDRHDKVLEYQFALARWIMASLVVVNGGALLALLGVADRFPEALTAAGPVFVAGLVLALPGGAVAWLNCNLITMAADERLHWEQLDTKPSKDADGLDLWAWRLAWLALLLTFTSLAAFPAGAVAADRAVQQRLSRAGTLAPVFSDEQMRALERAGIAKPVKSR